MNAFFDISFPDALDKKEKKQQQKNIHWFKKNHSFIAEQLEEITECYSVILRRKNKPVNIKAGHFEIYPEDAQDFSRSQLKKIIKNPIQMPPYRWGFIDKEKEKETQKNRHAIYDKYSYSLNLSLSKAIRNGDVLPPAQHVEKHAGFFAVLGLGLGFHIDLIFEHFDFVNLYIFETQIENIFHAARFHDFEKWDKALQKKEGALYFHLGSKWEDCAHYLSHAIGGREHLLQCGSHLMQHLDNNCFRSFVKKARPILNKGAVNKGFAEDEIIMFRNCFYNFISEKAHLISLKSRIALETPLLIIANGPSLDQHLDIIKKHAKTHIIFSCGSVLGVLLKNNIMPDFHCEVENSLSKKAIYQNLRDQGYDVSKIQPIFSSTCTPELKDYFARMNFFVRPATSPSTLISEKMPEMPFTLITVLNTATACGVSLGFKKIYLFGADCGSKKEHHHSKDSLYYQDDLPEEISYLKETPDLNYETDLPGNFGGRGRDQYNFNFSRGTISQLIGLAEDTIFYNCSDGIEIAEAIPLLGEIIPEYDKKTKEKDLTYLLADIKKIDLKENGAWFKKRHAQCEKLIYTLSGQLEKIFLPSSLPKNYDALVQMTRKFERIFKLNRGTKTIPARQAAQTFFSGSSFVMMQIIVEIFSSYKQGEERDYALEIILKQASENAKQMRDEALGLMAETRSLF